MAPKVYVSRMIRSFCSTSNVSSELTPRINTRKHVSTNLGTTLLYMYIPDRCVSLTVIKKCTSHIYCRKKTHGLVRSERKKS